MRWAAASSRAVKRPVDSITTSTPRSPQGSAGGLALGQHRDPAPPDHEVVAVDLDRHRPGGPGSSRSAGGGRWSRGEVRSFTATTSMSAPWARTARRKFRPIRPKPLMPTRTRHLASLLFSARAIRRRCRSLMPADPTRATASLAGSWTRPLAPARRPVDHRAGRTRPEGQAGLRVPQDHVDVDPVLAQRRHVGGHVVALGLGDLGAEVADVDPLGAGGGQRLGDARARPPRPARWCRATRGR